MQLVKPGQVSRARKGNRMVEVRAAFRCKQIIPAISLVKMRAFSQPERRAFENVDSFADKFAFLRRIFLKDNSGKAIGAWAVVPEHVHEIFSSVIIVEQRWIEAAAV